MQRTRKRAAAIAVALVRSITASSCWTFTTSTNTIVSGNLGYVYFRQVASDNIADQLHYGLNGGNARDTLNFMDTMLMSELFKNRLYAIGITISGFDYFFNPANDADFAEAAWRVNGTARCLVMHRNANPWGDRHNWTYREASDGHCTRGKGYI